MMQILASEEELCYNTHRSSHNMSCFPGRFSSRAPIQIGSKPLQKLSAVTKPTGSGTVPSFSFQVCYQTANTTIVLKLGSRLPPACEVCHSDQIDLSRADAEDKKKRHPFIQALADIKDLECVTFNAMKTEIQITRKEFSRRDWPALIPHIEKAMQVHLAQGKILVRSEDRQAPQEYA